MKNPNLFQLNLDRIPGFDALGAEDFSPASAEEKASMVENRASVSYWRDAARRFKANKVSMAALFLFLLYTTRKVIRLSKRKKVIASRDDLFVVEIVGFEPATLCLQSICSTS